MKKASKVMYVIAVVLNILCFFAVAAMFGGAYIMKHYPDQVAKLAVQYNVEQLNTVSKVLGMVTPVIIAAAVALVVSVVLLIFGIKAMKALEQNERNATPHIVVIVLSALCGELFYLLGSIFGVVNSSQAKIQTPEDTEEQHE